MDEIKRKVQRLKFWRMNLSSSIEKFDEESAGAKILYRLYVLSGCVIMAFEYAFGNSRKAYKMMKAELAELCNSEAFRVYSKLNHSLQEPVVDEETHKHIAILNQVLDNLIAQ